jgi:hypothetical protein
MRQGRSPTHAHGAGIGFGAFAIPGGLALQQGVIGPASIALNALSSLVASGP